MVKKHFTMHRRQFEADWERRKKYLLRSMFADPPVLSPIPEIRESRSRSLSPRPVVTVSSANRASPLPELIVERVRRYDDEPEEFYNKLEVKMKRYYRRIFYGEQIDSDDSDEIQCDESDPYCSNENLEVTEHDEFGQMGNKPEDDVDKENENKISDMSEDKNQTDSSNCNEILNETAGIENSDDSKHQSDTRGEDSDEIQKSIEKCGETQASSDSDTFVISPRRVASEPVEKRNIDKLAELEGINNEEHSNDSSYYEHNEEEEENVNEENSSESFVPGNTEMDVTDNISSTSIENQELVAEEEEVNVEEIEIMRKQASLSIRDSMPLINDRSIRQTLDLNVGRLSMEHISETTIRDSVDMEIESEHFSPVLQTTTVKQLSPILGLKRVATAPICNEQAKRKKGIFVTENNKIIEKQGETDNVRDNAIETEYLCNINIGLDKAVQHEREHVKEVGSQTETKVLRNVSTETDTNQADFIMQTEQRQPADFTNVGVQTDTREYTESSTQTTDRAFEYWNILEGINIYFFF